jgi:predicted AAA+ superfamily ATPase
LLVVLAESVPMKPNISKLSETLNTSHALVVEYMHYLEELGVLTLFHRDSFGITRLQKPEKVYLSHPNLQYSLHQSRPDTETLRESFFLSQVQPLHKVEYTDKGDFKLDRKVTIEVGGKARHGSRLLMLKMLMLLLTGLILVMVGRSLFGCLGYFIESFGGVISIRNSQ